MTQLREWSFAGTGGTIVARSWSDPSASPTHVALLSHGYGEHIGRYEHVADALIAHGAVVYGIDHLGHGKSDGEPVLVPDFEGVVTDLHTLDLAARDAWPGLPVVLIGHSMGGMIAARYGQLYGDSLTALVLSGPVIGEWEAAKQLLAMDEIPDVPLDIGTLSRDPSVGEQYSADPLVWHGPFKRTTLEAMQREVDSIAAGPDLGSLPTLWIHGEDDQLVPIEGARVGIEHLRGTRFSQHTYPAARHEVFNETNSGEVLDDVTGFLDNSLGRGSAAASA